MPSSLFGFFAEQITLRANPAAKGLYSRVKYSAKTYGSMNVSTVLNCDVKMVGTEANVQGCNN